MFIIPDTSALFGDYFFKNKFLEKISDVKIYRKYKLDLVVPEIVLDELYYQYHTKIGQKITSFKEINKMLLHKKKEKLEQLKLEECSNEYHDYIYGIWNYLNRNVLPYPKIDHKKVVERYGLGLKPFKPTENEREKERGYKDYLIWRTIVEFIASHKDDNEDFCLITANNTDFCDNNGNLHKELADELVTLGIDMSRLKIKRDFYAFYKDVIQSQFVEISKDFTDIDLAELIESEIYKESNIREQIINEIEFLGDTSSYKEPSIQTYEYVETLELTSLNVSQATKNDEGNLELEIELEVEADVDYWIDITDYFHDKEHGKPDYWLIEMPDLPAPEVQVGKHISVRLEVFVEIDEKTNKIISFEINKSEEGEERPGESEV